MPHSAGAIRPRPFRQFVVKLHSRCNLSCSYCYVYRHVDQGWRAQPAVMSTETVRVLAARIAEHARRHCLDAVALVIHGGEPLLAGPDRIADLVGAVRAGLPTGTTTDVTVQTNATLLDDGFLALFHRLGIRVGVSVDGGRAAHDRHRRHADGRPSHPAVARALARLASAEHRHLYAGLLATVDLANDPVRVYEDLLRHRPPEIDLLLPHGNWTNPPPGRLADSAATPYGDWLVAVFDRWYGAGTRETGIRLFESLISLVLGGPSRTEAVGSGAADAVTVETDGSLEATDALKTTAPGLAATGLTIRDHTFDAVARHPRVRAQRAGRAGLAAACRGCPVVAACGGGLYAHRYAADTGFANPSVYCRDLHRLVRHIRSWVAADVRLRAGV